MYKLYFLTVILLVSFSVQAQDSAEHYKNIGLFHAQKKEYQQALQNFNKAIAIDSAYDNAYNNRGITYRNLAMYKESIADLSIAIKLNPNDYAYFYNRAYTFKEMGKLKDALKDFSKAISLAPNKAASYAGRAGVLDEMKNYEKADTDYSKAIELDSSNTRYMVYRGISRMRTKNNYQGHMDFYKAADMGNQEISNIILKEFIRFVPNDTIFALSIRSSMKMYLGEYKDAIKDLNELIKTDPENGRAYYNRGLSEIRIKNKRKGCSDLRKALDFGEGDAQKEINKYCN